MCVTATASVHEHRRVTAVGNVKPPTVALVVVWPTPLAGDSKPTRLVRSCGGGARRPASGRTATTAAATAAAAVESGDHAVSHNNDRRTHVSARVLLASVLAHYRRRRRPTTTVKITRSLSSLTGTQLVMRAVDKMRDVNETNTRATDARRHRHHNLQSTAQLPTIVVAQTSQLKLSAAAVEWRRSRGSARRVVNTLERAAQRARAQHSLKRQFGLLTAAVSGALSLAPIDETTTTTTRGRASRRRKKLLTACILTVRLHVGSTTASASSKSEDCSLQNMVEQIV